jgi:hypothetical protein
MRRTPIVQRMLNFFDIPILETQLWETLEEERRMLAIQALARLIAQATRNPHGSEEDHDR